MSFVDAEPTMAEELDHIARPEDSEYHAVVAKIGDDYRVSFHGNVSQKNFANVEYAVGTKEFFDAIPAIFSNEKIKSIQFRGLVGKTAFWTRTKVCLDALGRFDTDVLEGGFVVNQKV